VNGSRIQIVFFYLSLSLFLYREKRIGQKDDLMLNISFISYLSYGPDRRREEEKGEVDHREGDKITHI